jgi:hypothetical protein
MTEADWLATTDPRAMLKYLTHRPDHDPEDPRFLLFAVASLRQQWHLLVDARSRAAVLAAEGLAEGRLSERDVEYDWEQAELAYDEAEENTSEGEQEAGALALYAAWAAFSLLFCGYDDAWFSADVHARNHLPPSFSQGLAPVQVSLARCIFGNPFRPVSFDPAWLTPLVRSLAEAAHDDRREPEGTLDVERLVILADALEDAGCTDTAILNHLRSTVSHVRGCWVIDILLGKE